MVIIDNFCGVLFLLEDETFCLELHFISSQGVTCMFKQEKEGLCEKLTSELRLQGSEESREEHPRKKVEHVQTLSQDLVASVPGAEKQ